MTALIAILLLGYILNIAVTIYVYIDNESTGITLEELIRTTGLNLIPYLIPSLAVFFIVIYWWKKHKDDVIIRF